MDIQQLREKISSFELPEPVAKISLSSTGGSISMNLPEITRLDSSSFDNFMINRNICINTIFSGENSGYEIDTYETLRRIRSEVNDSIMTIFYSCIESKVPKRTNMYSEVKKLVSTARMSDVDSKIFSEIYDLCDYYYLVNEKSSIRDEENKVHRKNMIALLKGLTEAYGRPNSNK